MLFRSPISVFATMIGRNVRSRKAPTPINNNAITKNIRLKYVNTFDFTIYENPPYGIWWSGDIPYEAGTWALPSAGHKYGRYYKMVITQISGFSLYT